MLGDDDDYLQLMYEQMHVLSPLVTPQEFFFLRFCRQLSTGVWVVVDVSYEHYRENPRSHPYTWKHPSGCMIQDMSNGCSMVTWAEVVEVDDKSPTQNHLYRDIEHLAYGAERWVVTLQRMSERLSYSTGESSTNRQLGGVINNREGNRSIMKLSHRMVKSFSSILSMSKKLDFPRLSKGVQFSVRMSDQPGQPSGMVASAATSLWLPLSWETLYDFFRDVKKRSQWDVLSNGSPVQEIANISIPTHPGNSVSLVQHSGHNVLMLQENCIDSLGALVVYASLDIPAAIGTAISGKDSANIPILPSGVTMCSGGHSDKLNGASSRSGGSLLTMAFQIMSPSKDLDMDFVANVNTFVISTVQKIKAALDCSDLNREDI